ncbi:MAG: VapE family protein [Fermentimonas sp.]|nr:VapE family protein [Fermentimonas sp.]
MSTIKLPEINAGALEFVDDRIQDIVDTINEAFVVKTSCLDPSKFSIESKDKSRYRYKPTMDTLYLYLKGIGKSISRTDLRIMLRDQNYFDQENPILNYFDKIRGTYKGESHIDKLCSHITPRSFDKEPNYYRERMNFLIRKWMVASVAQWKDGIPNAVALGFISMEEYIGKTFLTRFFLPESLEGYYVQPENDSRFSLSDVFTRYLIVCFDDLVGINKGTARIEEFKKYTRSQMILVQRRNDEFPTERNRVAVPMFTANRTAEMGGFLTQNHGTSRYGTVEVEKIDKRYSQRVKVDQMWAEALMLYENSEFDPFYSDEYIQELQDYNQRYLIQTDEEKYVKLYILPPDDEEDEEAEWLTASDIVHRLRKERKISSADKMKVTPQAVGKALSSLGFVKESKRVPTKSYPEYRYQVKFNL